MSAQDGQPRRRLVLAKTEISTAGARCGTHPVKCAHLRREKSWCCLFRKAPEASEYDSASARRYPLRCPDCLALDQEKKS